MSRIKRVPSWLQLRNFTLQGRIKSIQFNISCLILKYSKTHLAAIEVEQLANCLSTLNSLLASYNKRTEALEKSLDKVKI
jgi:hypothetical protein